MNKDQFEDELLKEWRESGMPVWSEFLLNKLFQQKEKNETK
jgi:hypothetical protein